MKNWIISYLMSDYLLHVDMIEGLKRNSAVVVDYTENGVLLYNQLADAFMISAINQDTYVKLVKNNSIGNSSAIVAHQAFYVEDLVNSFKYTSQKKCWQFVYLSNINLNYSNRNLIIKVLTVDNLDFVYYYSLKMSKSYLLERLETQNIYGAYKDNNLVGFIGVHQDGSIGLLEVIEPFRRQGIATSLVSFMTNLLLKEGHTPYAQAIEGNTGTLRICMKTMYHRLLNQFIYWLEK